MAASFLFKHNHASKLIAMLAVKLLSPLVSLYRNSVGPALRKLRIFRIVPARSRARLERALEAALEAVFDARSDVDNFKLRLLGFSVGIDRLTVADRDDPMRNLFQTDRLRFRLRPQAVLQGKVYIEEIRADSMLFGTERTVSGALPGKPGKVKPPKPPKPGRRQRRQVGPGGR
jgi:hypothetical protein